MSAFLCNVDKRCNFRMSDLCHRMRSVRLTERTGAEMTLRQPVLWIAKIPAIRLLDVEAFQTLFYRAACGSV